MNKTKFKSTHGAGSLGAQKRRKGSGLGAMEPKRQPKAAKAGMAKMGRKKYGKT